MSNTSTQAVSRQIKVPFHGTELYVVDHGGEPYTPMRVIVEGMGLDWKSQYVKVKQRFSTCVVEITMQLPNDSQRRPVTCLPIKKLPGWLHSINIGKIRPELRDRVAAYQAECDDALWQYWNEGIAVNPRVAFSVGPDDILTADQQETLRLMVKTLVERLPKAQQGAAAIKVWSKLKSHFKVAYRQIPRSEFTEAVSIVTRTAAEWEVVVEPVTSPLSDEAAKTNIHSLCWDMLWIRGWWQQYGMAIHALSPHAAAVIHDHLVSGASTARHLAAFSGRRIDESHIRDYPWMGSSAERHAYLATRA